MKGALAIAALLALAVAAPARGDDPLRIMVYNLIAERLELMEPVAAWKHANGVPVENPEREAVVLDHAAQDAARTGMAPDTVLMFFQAQIAASKAIQHCWIARWQAGETSPPADPPDLKADIRPKLLTIGSALLRLIREALSAGVDFERGHGDDFADEVNIDCLEAAERDEIHHGLIKIRLAN